RKKLSGTVRKIIKTVAPSQSDKAEIAINEGDDLYREIRVENVVTDERGEKAELKPGAELDVTIEADSDATTRKADTPRERERYISSPVKMFCLPKRQDSRTQAVREFPVFRKLCCLRLAFPKCGAESQRPSQMHPSPVLQLSTCRESRPYSVQ